MEGCRCCRGGEGNGREEARKGGSPGGAATLPGPWFQSLRPGLRNGTSPSFLAEARIAELASLRSWYRHGAGPGPRARSQCHSSTPMTPTFCVGVTSQTTCLQPHGSTLHRNRAPPSLVPLSPHIHTHSPSAHAHTQTPSMCTAHAHRLNQCARTHTRTPHPHMPTHVHRACVHTHTHADTHAHTRTSTRMKPSPHRRDPGAEHTESPVRTGT